MNLPGNDIQVTLADGRKLGARIYGDPSFQNSILYFHGFPGSRLECAVVDSWSREHGITVVAPDRPGFGISSPKPGRTLLDWPKDIDQLTDGLGIGQFSLLGVSGGVPYALAMAAVCSERVKNVAVVSGVSELTQANLMRDMVVYNRLLLQLGRSTPRLGAGIVNVIARSVGRWPGFFFAVMKFFSSLDDSRILSKAEVKRLFLHNFREATFQGGAGAIDDFFILTKPWGFKLEEIKANITLWHGEDDKHVPISMGRYIGSKIPEVKERFVPGRGHLMIFDLVEAIIKESLNIQTAKKP